MSNALRSLGERINEWISTVPEPQQHLMAAVGSGAVAGMFYGAEVLRMRLPYDHPDRNHQSVSAGLGFVTFSLIALKEASVYKATRREQ